MLEPNPVGLGRVQPLDLLERTVLRRLSQRPFLSFMRLLHLSVVRLD